MPNALTAIVLMIFEAGGLSGLLPSHEAGNALSNKVLQAAETALADGQPHFTIEMTPTEIGMALSATSGSQSPLAQTVAEKLRKGLADKLEELGIQYPEQTDASSDPNGFWAQDPSDNGGVL